MYAASYAFPRYNEKKGKNILIVDDREKNNTISVEERLKLDDARALAEQAILLLILQLHNKFLEDHIHKLF